MAGASYRCQTKHQNGEENDLKFISSLLVVVD